MPRCTDSLPQQTVHISWVTPDTKFEAEGPENAVMQAFQDFSDYMAIRSASDVAAIKGT